MKQSAIHRSQRMCCRLYTEIRGFCVSAAVLASTTISPPTFSGSTKSSQPQIVTLPSVGLILVLQAALVLAKAARVHLMLRGAVIQLLGDSLLDLHLGPLGLRDFGR